MGLFDRLSRLVRADLNALISAAEDPEKILNQTIEDMHEELTNVRRAVADAIAAEKSLEQKLADDQQHQQEWQDRAESALRNHDEDLARQAIIRKKTYVDSAAGLQQQISEQQGRVTILRDTLGKLERKLSEANSRKDVLISRAQVVRSAEALQTSSTAGSESAVGTFDRMEEKIDALEAFSSTDLSDEDALEDRFATLSKDHHDVDAELAALKDQLALPPQT